MRTLTRGLLATSLATLCMTAAAFSQTITQWNFNSNPPDASTSTGSLVPSTGTGTLTLIGGTTSTFAGGAPTDPAASDNSAINTAGYPAQSAGSGTGGIKFAVSTVGKNNVMVTYDQRLSNTASSWWRFEYTTDGTNFVTTGLTDAGSGPGVYQFPVANVVAGSFAPTYSWNLTSVAAVNNNGNFAFRVVSIFDPSNNATYTGANTQTGSAYGHAGTSRFDMVTVTQGAATGSCCVTGSTVCSTTTLAACAGIWSNGSACTPNPCSGSCCTGGACAAGVSPVDCANANTQTFTVAGVCSPNPCPHEIAAIANDIAYAANVGVLSDSVQQVRGAGSASPTRVGTWGGAAFIEFIQFDNANGGNHNPQGNLLAEDFGTVANGAVLYNLSTNGAGAAQTVYTFNPTNPLALPVSRGGGLAVSPNNQLIAIGNYDTAQVTILKYSAGSTVGTGAGAGITAGVSTDNTTFLFKAAVTTGVAWISNTQVAVFVQGTDPLGVFPPNAVAVFTLDYDPTSNTITAVTPRVLVDDTNVPDGSRYLGLAYNPAISPYLYTMSSGFITASGSHSRIGVINVATWTQVATMDVSTSANTGRAIAVGADRYLYFNQFAGSGTLPTSGIIERINLDTDNNGVINAADLTGLTDNSSVDFYLQNGATTSSFNGLDIAISGPAVTTGVCCNGSTCAIGATAASCTGANHAFLSSSASCNASGNRKTPCCEADFNHVGGITVQDIFDFLSAWFAKNPNANITSNGAGAPTVQSIFDFLSAWFAKGC